MSQQLSQTDPVNEVLPTGKLFVLGLQHVLVMYAGAIAVPLILGRALKLTPDQVTTLISADLFVCGLVTLIQSLGIGKLFGIRLPVMMGVTFASLGPMVAIANANPTIAGAQSIFGAIIGAGIISILIAPIMSKLLRFFPPIVTGSIILVIGVSLMPVGINWIFGIPVGLTAPLIPNPEHVMWLKEMAVLAAQDNPIPEMPVNLTVSPSVFNPAYAPLFNIGVSALVLTTILLVSKFFKGFLGNISVLIGIIVGSIVAALFGKMHFDQIDKAHWFDLVTPLPFGMPIFDPILIATMTVVMVVVMIESSGMFLALGELTNKKLSTDDLARGLRVDGLGTLIGGIFNVFPYTSFSQNIGLVGISGVKSRYVCVAGGIILMTMGLIPKLAALAESTPVFVLGGAGLVMFGMVATTGIRILSSVDFKTNRNNSLIIAISLGFGMIPTIAPKFMIWLPHAIHPLIDSGILLASVAAILLNLLFNGVKSAEEAAKEAAENTHGSE
jgi:NCS2 family nucleobase:cation symporter-2